MENIGKAFGAEIRRHREKQSISQEAFAEKAGIHRTYVSSIELGKVDVSLNVADKATKALGKKLSEIIAKAEKNL